MGNSTITWNAARLQVLSGAMTEAAKISIEALKNEVVGAGVMPFDLGDMQNNQTFTEAFRDGSRTVATLSTGSPQARRLYFHPEYNFQRGHNYNAGGKWLEPWSIGDKKDWVKETFIQAYKEITRI